MTKYISILAALFFISCSKIPTTDIANLATDIKNNEKSVSMLNTVGIGLLELSNDEDFKNLVHKQINIAFDDDFNVLLKTINDEKSDLRSIFQQSIQKYGAVINKNSNTTSLNYTYFQDNIKLGNAINGFKMAQEVWYSQIYVPFHKEVDLQDIPTIAIGNINTKSDILIGYKLDAYGNLEILNVDEQYAKTHLTWVISVNESVNNDGVLTTNLVKPQKESNTKNNEKFVGVTQIKISDKKEKWWQGKADVSFGWSVINTPSGTGCNNTNWNEALETIKIGNNDLNTWKTINQTLASGNGNTNDLETGETILFTMFEYDKGAGLRELLFPPCYHSYYYRSDDNFYAAWGPNQSMDYADFPNAQPHPNWTYRTKSDGNEHVKFRYYER